MEQQGGGGNNSVDGFDAKGSIPCANGCGFFGNPATMNYCSVCYKKAMGEKGKQASSTAPTSSAPVPTSSSSTSSTSSTSSAPLPPPSTTTSSSSPPEDTSATNAMSSHVQERTDRCWSCHKRIGLTGFKCRCGYVFCGQHRYSDKHNCSFDYKVAGREALTKANPTVRGQKIEKL